MREARQVAKVDVCGVGVSVTDYAAATRAVMTAARERRSFGVTALATHGLVTAARQPSFNAALARLDLVTPDGQPVRWAMNALWGTRLAERVYGPDLTVEVCAAAARDGVGVYLFGSTAATLEAMTAELRRRFPSIVVAGAQPDRFRDATPQEDGQDVARIAASGAGVVLVGRGCPRQERWVAAHLGADAGPRRVDAAMLAVGAAFDYLAGNLARPPAWMQRRGLEWLFRLYLEPRRLLRRYAVHNTLFVLLVGRDLLRRGREGRRVSSRAVVRLDHSLDTSDDT